MIGILALVVQVLSGSPSWAGPMSATELIAGVERQLSNISTLSVTIDRDVSTAILHCRHVIDFGTMRTRVDFPGKPSYRVSVDQGAHRWVMAYADGRTVTSPPIAWAVMPATLPEPSSVFSLQETYGPWTEVGVVPSPEGAPGEFIITLKNGLLPPRGAIQVLRIKQHPGLLLSVDGYTASGQSTGSLVIDWQAVGDIWVPRQVTRRSVLNDDSAIPRVAQIVTRWSDVEINQPLPQGWFTDPPALGLAHR